MRTAAALVVVAAALVGMASLLVREGTQLWHFAAVGAVAGVLAGGVRWGWRAALVGLAAGCVIGLAAPFLYIPFWVAFTLPPLPEIDL